MAGMFDFEYFSGILLYLKLLCQNKITLFIPQVISYNFIAFIYYLCLLRDCWKRGFIMFLHVLVHMII